MTYNVFGGTLNLAQLEHWLQRRHHVAPSPYSGDKDGMQFPCLCSAVRCLQVQYNINGWLDKNKDPIQECVVQLMQESKEPLVAVLFKEPEEGMHQIARVYPTSSRQRSIVMSMSVCLSVCLQTSLINHM